MTNTTNTSMNQEMFFGILNNLIEIAKISASAGRPVNSTVEISPTNVINAVDIPNILSEIIGVYNLSFTAPPPVAKVKRSYTIKQGSSQGWAHGVGKDEYRTWKAQQQALGVTENLNSHEYKRQYESGAINRADYQTGSDDPVNLTNPSNHADITNSDSVNEPNQTDAGIIINPAEPSGIALVDTIDLVDAKPASKKKDRPTVLA